jgi:soluble lytic murein transglycosylase-like protein
MKVLVLIFIVCLAASPGLVAEIVVKQDKEGKITITNNQKDNPFNRYRAKTKSKRSSSSSEYTVPSHYMLKIRTLARKYGVSESLITAVARAESSFNRLAVSKKGAVGIMQLMEDTARQYGVINRYNADQNMDAGVRHLKYLYGKYSGKLPLVLAAYNAGENAVAKYKGIPPYSETKDYIKRVMRFMGMSYSGSFTSGKLSQRIYQYRDKTGKIVITDSFPTNAASGSITIFE